MIEQGRTIRKVLISVNTESCIRCRSSLFSGPALVVLLPSQLFVQEKSNKKKARRFREALAELLEFFFQDLCSWDWSAPICLASDASDADLVSPSVTRTNVLVQMPGINLAASRNVSEPVPWIEGRYRLSSCWMMTLDVDRGSDEPWFGKQGCRLQVGCMLVHLVQVESRVPPRDPREVS